MGPPHFGRVVCGPPAGAINELVGYFLGALPNLFSDADQEAVQAKLTREAVRAQLSLLREQLHAPGGWGMKQLIREDPLGLHLLALRKLGYANTIPKVHIQDGHFVSSDGLRLLMIADSPVNFTDTAGSKAMLEHFQGLVNRNLPQGIRASLVSGHRYASANAEAVKGDMVKVLGFSCLMIAVIFVVFVRSWWAVFLFLLPGSAVCLAALGMRAIQGEISGITLGFGGVLLGITVDYGIHVYFALSTGEGPSDLTLREVSRPVLFSGMTSLAAFGVLLFSDLPGQRQLALFSVLGIAAALILSLVALPHLIPQAAGGRRKTVFALRMPGSGMRRLVIGLWLPALLLGLWMATKVEINGDLRSANLVTPELAAAEEEIRETWGQMKGRSIAFLSADNLESTLKANDRLFARLSADRVPSVTSLAPVLPSLAQQEANRARWTSFWERVRGDLQDLLQEEGRALGFSKAAFDPFLERLLQLPPPVLAENLREVGLGDLLDTLMRETPAGFQIITLAEGRPDRLASGAAPDDARTGVRWVSEGRFGDAVSGALRNDFVSFLGKASAAVLLLLLLMYRSPVRVACTLVPVATGLILMFGTMGAIGIPFNLFNIIAAILVIGLGVDYGIFMVVKLSEGYTHDTEMALLVSGLTTLAGLGSLVLAGHPALYSIGITVLLGLGTAVPAALLVIPALYGNRHGKSG